MKNIFVITLTILVSSCVTSTQVSEKKLCVENLEVLNIIKENVEIQKPILKSSCCEMVNDEKIKKELLTKEELPWNEIDINISDGLLHPQKYSQSGNILHLEYFYISLNERFYTAEITKVDSNRIEIDFKYLSKINPLPLQEQEVFFKMSCDIIVPKNGIKYEIWFRDK